MNNNSINTHPNLKALLSGLQGDVERRRSTVVATRATLVTNEDIAHDRHIPTSACCRAETFLLGSDDHTVVCGQCGELCDQY